MNTNEKLFSPPPPYFLQLLIQYIEGISGTHFKGTAPNQGPAPGTTSVESFFRGPEGALFCMLPASHRCGFACLHCPVPGTPQPGAGPWTGGGMYALF